MTFITGCGYIDNRILWQKISIAHDIFVNMSMIECTDISLRFDFFFPM